MKTKKPINAKQAVRIVIILGLAIGIYGILPQISSFKGSFSYLKLALHSDNAVIALLFSLLTFAFAGLTYKLLAMKPIGLGKTTVMQFSAMFINKLLPGGIGALGMNAAYLHKEKHTLTQSGIIVGLNNVLGMVGHALLLGIVYLFWRNDILFKLHASPRVKTYLLVVGSLLVLAAIVALKVQSKSRIKNLKKQMSTIAKYYGSEPWRLGFALLSAMSLTLCFTLCLYFSIQATHIAGVSIPAALVLLTLGVGAGTAVPLPGGLGGVETGIYAGLVSGMHADAKPALAAVLLFRLVSYWIPLVFGLSAFLYSSSQKWFTFAPAQSGSQQKQQRVQV